MKAFEAGAKHVNPKATMKVVYLGGFNDVGKGKEAAQSLAASGVDVVYHIADAAGVGVINGAQAAGIKAIGWGLDQNSIAPDTLIASQLVNQKDEIGDICKSIVNGRFKGGLKVEGLRSGLIGISKVYNEPPSVQQKVDQLKKQIMDGKVDVPPISPGVPSSGPQGG
jgi:basic membrane lipoprotein Med (substrate-binding protein (PBP1-ABC) superfamily)